MRIPHYILLCLLLLAASICYCQSGDGTITGTVVNEQGDPVSGATIWCSVNEGQQTTSKGSGLSDKAGKFQVQHLPWNTYSVSASKSADGYQRSQAEPESVTLTPEQLSATVVVKLGPKEAMLVPTVVDKITREPVFDFSVHWTVEAFDGQGQYNQSASSGVSRWTKQVLLPANKDVMLHVTKPGYRTWWYMDPSQPNGPGILRLQSGETKQLTIELEPASATAP